MTVSLLKRYSPCTCHSVGPEAKPRLSNFMVGEEGFHLDDQTFATIAHIHYDYYATDCDGAHGSDHTIRPDENEDEWDFWQGAVRRLVFAHADQGQLKVRTDRYNHDDREATWTEATDEGGKRESIRWCRDLHCAHNGAGPVYDQFAQAAGY